MCECSVFVLKLLSPSPLFCQDSLAEHLLDSTAHPEEARRVERSMKVMHESLVCPTRPPFSAATTFFKGCKAAELQLSGGGCALTEHWLFRNCPIFNNWVSYVFGHGACSCLVFWVVGLGFWKQRGYLQGRGKGFGCIFRMTVSRTNPSKQSRQLTAFHVQVLLMPRMHRNPSNSVINSRMLGKRHTCHIFLRCNSRGNITASNLGCVRTGKGPCK